MTGPMRAADWDARYAQRELVWSAGPNRFLVDQAAGLAPGRALDVGAGEGRNAIWLAEQGWAVTAVDFSAVGCAKGRQLAASRGVAVDWVVADVTVWDPPPAAFDLVVVLYLQLPEAERRQAHMRAATAVAAGGTLLVVGHDRDNLSRGTGGPQDPALLLTAAAVTADLTGTDLVIDVAEQVIRAADGEDGQRRSAIDCLVRAHRPRTG